MNNLNKIEENTINKIINKNTNTKKNNVNVYNVIVNNNTTFNKSNSDDLKKYTSNKKTYFLKTPNENNSALNYNEQIKYNSKSDSNKSVQNSYIQDNSNYDISQQNNNINSKENTLNNLNYNVNDYDDNYNNKSDYNMDNYNDNYNNKLDYNTNDYNNNNNHNNRLDYNTTNYNNYDDRQNYNANDNNDNYEEFDTNSFNETPYDLNIKDDTKMHRFQGSLMSGLIFVSDVTDLTQTTVGSGFMYMSRELMPILYTAGINSKKREISRVINNIDKEDFSKVDNILEKTLNKYRAGITFNNLDDELKIKAIDLSSRDYFSKHNIDVTLIDKTKKYKEGMSFGKDNKKLSNEEAVMLNEYNAFKDNENFIIEDSQIKNILSNNNLLYKYSDKKTAYRIKNTKEGCLEYLKSRGFSKDILKKYEKKDLEKALRTGKLGKKILNEDDKEIISGLITLDKYDKKANELSKLEHSRTRWITRQYRKILSNTDVYRGAMMVGMIAKLSYYTMYGTYKVGRLLGRGIYRTAKFTTKIVTAPFRINKTSREAVDAVGKKINNIVGKADNVANKVDKFINPKTYKNEKLRKKKIKESKIDSKKYAKTSKKKINKKYKKANKKANIFEKLSNVKEKVKEKLLTVIKGAKMFLFKLAVILVATTLLGSLIVMLLNLAMTPQYIITSIADNVKTFVYGKSKQEAFDDDANKIIKYVNSAYRDSVNDITNKAVSNILSSGSIADPTITVNYTFNNAGNVSSREDGSIVTEGPPTRAILAMTCIYFDNDFQADDTWISNTGVYDYAKALTKKAIKSSYDIDVNTHTEAQIARGACNSHRTVKYKTSKKVTKYYYEIENRQYGANGSYTVVDTTRKDLGVDDGTPNSSWNETKAQEWSKAHNNYPYKTEEVTLTTEDTYEACNSHYLINVNLEMHSLGVVDANDNEIDLNNTLFKVGNDLDEGAEGKPVNDLPKWLNAVKKTYAFVKNSKDSKYKGSFTVDYQQDGWIYGENNSVNADNLTEDDFKSTREWVRNVAYQDWKAIYGFDVDQAIGTMEESDIKKILQSISKKYNISDTRLDILRNAFRYVGVFTYSGKRNVSDTFEELDRGVGQVSQTSFINFVLKKHYGDEYNFGTNGCGNTGFAGFANINSKFFKNVDADGTVSKLTPGDVVSVGDTVAIYAGSGKVRYSVNRKKQVGDFVFVEPETKEREGTILIMCDIDGDGSTTKLVVGKEADVLLKEAEKSGMIIYKPKDDTNLK